MRDKPAATEQAELRLTVFLPGRPGSAHTLSPGRRYRLGRSPDCDVQIDDDGVSRLHLILEAEPDGWLASDQVSKNGVRLNGRPIDRAMIEHRDWLDVGGVAILAELSRVGTNPAPPSPGNTEDDAQESGSLERAVADFAELAGCERAGIWRLVAPEDFELVHGTNRFDPPPSFSAMRRVAESGDGQFCSDTEGARALAASESISTGGIRALVVLPIVSEGRVAAVAYADSVQPGKLFTQHDADLLEAAARHLALILDSGRVRSLIRSLRRRL